MPFKNEGLYCADFSAPDKKRGKRHNFKDKFPYFTVRSYVVRIRNGSNEGSQYMFWLTNKKIYS